MNDLQWLTAMIEGIVMWEIGCDLGRLIRAARDEWLAQRDKRDRDS
jgi:hypothetical protein